LIDFFGLLF